jgi:hypothetical protein
MNIRVGADRAISILESSGMKKYSIDRVVVYRMPLQLSLVYHMV